MNHIEKLMLPGKDCPTDLMGLSALLNKAGIKHTLQVHPVCTKEPGVKALIGYYPAGEWQIIIPASKDARPNRRKESFSIIRGAVSFGDFEIWGPGMPDPERRETEEEMLELIKEKLPT